MTSNQATSTIQVEIEHLLYYRKSKIGLFVGTLVEPLMSHGEIFVDAGKECKIKIKFDCIDLQQLRSARVLEFVIRNSCEEKFYFGRLIKQFTAEAVTNYTSEEAKSSMF